MGRAPTQHTSERQAMKIVVIGGSGLIGSKLVTKLREDGHDPLAASPDSGVDTITGEGLAEALEGAHAVVDVANAPAFEDAAVLEFFQTSSRNLVAAETAAGVRHHVVLSVVGTDRLDELARRVLSANNDRRQVIPDVHARYFGAELDDRSLTPGDDARIAPTHFEDWLSQTVERDPLVDALATRLRRLD